MRYLWSNVKGLFVITYEGVLAIEQDVDASPKQSAESKLKRNAMFTSRGFVQYEELTKHKKLKMNRKNLTRSTQHRIFTAWRFLDDVNTTDRDSNFTKMSFSSDLLVES